MTTWCEKVRSAPPDDDRRFFDTHPPLADRLKAIEGCPEPLAIRQQTDPATTLLADPPTTRKAVQTLLFGPTPTLQWSDPGILTEVRTRVEQGLLLQEAVYRLAGTSRPTVAFVRAVEALVHQALSRGDIASLRLWLRNRDVPLGFQLAPVKVPVA